MAEGEERGEGRQPPAGDGSSRVLLCGDDWDPFAEVVCQAPGPSLPDAPPAIAHQAALCRPLHVAGPVIACVRERVAAHAVRLGWRWTNSPTAGLHLLADGQRIEPASRGLAIRFPVPAAVRRIWLVSDAIDSDAVDDVPQSRAVGVCIERLVVDDGFAPLAVAADDPRLCLGFHDAQPGPRRWTAGRACLPADLWSHCPDGFFLRVEMAREAPPRWIAPGIVAADGSTASPPFAGDRACAG